MESAQSAARVSSCPSCHVPREDVIDVCLLRGATPRHCFLGRGRVIHGGAVPAAAFRVETVCV